MAIKRSTFRQQPEFLRGRSAERMIAEELQRRGWLVLPSYDYTTEEEKAPRLQGWEISYIVPDLDVCRNGKRYWVEVKAKAKADWTRSTQRYEHGIDRHHYESYLAVQRQTGCPVWLCVYEENTQLAFIRSLDDLALVARFYGGQKMNRSGMVFFPRAAFHQFAFLQPLG
jgi:hypothetical protein